MGFVSIVDQMLHVIHVAIFAHQSLIAQIKFQSIHLSLIFLIQQLKPCLCHEDILFVFMLVSHLIQISFCLSQKAFIFAADQPVLVTHYGNLSILAVNLLGVVNEV